MDPVSAAAAVQALSSFLQMRQQEELEKKRAEQDAYKQMMANNSQLGTNQANAMANIMGNYRSALLG